MTCQEVGDMVVVVFVVVVGSVVVVDVVGHLGFGVCVLDIGCDVFKALQEGRNGAWMRAVHALSF